MGILHVFNRQLNQLPVRITLLFGAIFLGVTLFTISIVFDYLRDNVILIREEYGQTILQMATADALTATNSSDAGAGLQPYAAALFGELAGIEGALYNEAGTLVTASSSRQWPATVPTIADATVSVSQINPETLLDLTTENALLLYQPVQVNPTTRGWQAIRLELATGRELSSSLYNRFITGMLSTLTLIVASGVYLRSYTRRNLEPLLRLTHKIGQINWDAELSTRLNGEFRELGDGIAEMQENLAAYEAQRRTLLDRISHDILGPLRTIAMIAELYQNPDTLEENDWSIVYISTQHVTRLLEDLKYLMNRRIDFLPVMPDESIAIEPVIEQVLTYYRAKSAGRQINFHLQPDNGAPLCTPIESTRLMQLLGNLLDNAMTHGRASEITITLQQRQGEGGQKWVQLVVHDNGIGIAEAHQTRVFAERYSTAKGTGANQGLGLAIVKDIVDHHQGTIAVQSEEGRGTAFVIRLPQGECMGMGELVS